MRAATFLLRERLAAKGEERERKTQRKGDGKRGEKERRKMEHTRTRGALRGKGAKSARGRR